MTDPNPLREDEVEAVAMALCAASGLDWSLQANFLTSAGGTGEEQDGFRDMARAAILRLDQVREGRGK